jgi:hypothetical protein
MLFCVLTACARTLPALLCFQLLAGVGAGWVFGTGTYLLGRTPRPERGFSVMLGVQAACSCAFAAALPIVYLHYGYTTAVSSVALWFVAIFLGAWQAPQDATPGVRSVGTLPVRRPRESLDLRSLSVVLGIMSFEIAVLAVWMYSDRVGEHWGLAADRVGTGIALGGLGAIPAGAMGLALGDRYGHSRLVILATVLVLGSEAAMLHPLSFTFYAAGQFTLNFGWTLGLSYYMGFAAKHDARGRIIPLVPAAVIVATGVAPLCVATFGRDGDLASIFAISVFFSVIALLLLISTRLGRGTVSWGVG